MIIQSEKMAYDGARYIQPLWQLDTDNYVVIHYDERYKKEESSAFHSECVRYHIDYICAKEPKRLKELVDGGEILTYLERFEDRVYDELDRQTEKLRAEDPEPTDETEELYELQAKEIVYAAIVYA